MDELHRASDKLDQSASDLYRMLARLDPDDPDSINIALGIAKRVRRESQHVVRALARLRDDDSRDEQRG